MASVLHFKKRTAPSVPTRRPDLFRASAQAAERSLKELLSDLPKGAKLVKVSLPPPKPKQP